MGANSHILVWIPFPLFTFYETIVNKVFLNSLDNGVCHQTELPCESSNRAVSSTLPL